MVSIDRFLGITTRIFKLIDSLAFPGFIQVIFVKKAITAHASIDYKIPVSYIILLEGYC